MLAFHSAYCNDNQSDGGGPRRFVFVQDIGVEKCFVVVKFFNGAWTQERTPPHNVKVWRGASLQSTIAKWTTRQVFIPTDEATTKARIIAVQTLHSALATM